MPSLLARAVAALLALEDGEYARRELVELFVGLGLSPGYAQRVVDELRCAGLLKRVRRGVYRVVRSRAVELLSARWRRVEVEEGGGGRARVAAQP